MCLKPLLSVLFLLRMSETVLCDSSYYGEGHEYGAEEATVAPNLSALAAAEAALEQATQDLIDYYIKVNTLTELLESHRENLEKILKNEKISPADRITLEILDRKLKYSLENGNIQEKKDADEHYLKTLALIAIQMLIESNESDESASGEQIDRIDPFMCHKCLQVCAPSDSPLDPRSESTQLSQRSTECPWWQWRCWFS